MEIKCRIYFTTLTNRKMLISSTEQKKEIKELRDQEFWNNLNY